MARARMGYRCHGWRHLGRSTKRWRSAGIGSCRRTPLGGTRGSSALHAPDGRPEGSDGRHIDCKQITITIVIFIIIVIITITSIITLIISIIITILITYLLTHSLTYLRTYVLTYSLIYPIKPD